MLPMDAGPVRAAPKAAPAPPANPAAALQAFHTSEAQSHVPAVQRQNAALAQRAVAAAPLQAFHTAEAQSHIPAVQAHNEALGQQAVAQQRHQAALALIQQHEDAALQRAKALGAYGPQIALATIHSPANAGGLASLMKPAAGILGNLGTDLVQMPRQMIQGGYELGKTAITDPTHLPDLVSQMAQQDALYNFLTGNFSKAGDLAFHHPLGAGLDLAMGAGAAGRALSAAGRAADVGALSRAADLTRTPSFPGEQYGIAPPMLRGSKNLFTNLALKGADKVLNSNPTLAKPWFTHEMKVRADEHQPFAHDLVVRARNDAINAAKEKGLGPTLQAREGEMAARRAKGAAVIESLKGNALRNRRNGNIFFSPSTRNPIGKTRMEAQGIPMVKVPVSHFIPNSKQLMGERTPHVIVPQAYYDRMMTHQMIGRGLDHTLSRGWRQFIQNYRGTVLPFSPKWQVGSVTEGTGRAALAGAGPQHNLLARNVLNAMESQGHILEAQRLQSAALRGQQLGSAAYESEALKEARGVSGAAKNVAMALPRGIRAAQTGIFKGNRAVERQFGLTVLGKHMAGEQKRLGLDTQGLAQHYANPRVAANAGRFTQRVLGKYHGYSPSMRTVIGSGVSPFAPWYLNAAKFTGALPFQHPALTAALTAAAHATDKQWQADHKDLFPGGLLASPKVGPHSYRDVGYFTPFAPFANTTGMKLPETAATTALSTVAPEVSSPALSLFGLDPFGRALTYPGPASKYTPKLHKLSTAKAHPAKTGIAGADLNMFLSDILGEQVPGASQAQRVLVNRGGTPYSGSPIWDVTAPQKNQGHPFNISGILAGLARVFNPFRATVVNPTKPTKRKGGFGSGGGFGHQTGGFGAGGSGQFGSAR